MVSYLGTVWNYFSYNQSKPIATKIFEHIEFHNKTIMPLIHFIKTIPELDHLVHYEDFFNNDTIQNTINKLRSIQKIYDDYDKTQSTLYNTKEPFNKTELVHENQIIFDTNDHPMIQLLHMLDIYFKSEGIDNIIRALFSYSYCNELNSINREKVDFCYRKRDYASINNRKEPTLFEWLVPQACISCKENMTKFVVNDYFIIKDNFPSVKLLLDYITGNPSLDVPNNENKWVKYSLFSIFLHHEKDNENYHSFIKINKDEIEIYDNNIFQNNVIPIEKQVLSEHYDNIKIKSLFLIYHKNILNDPQVDYMTIE